MVNFVSDIISIERCKTHSPISSLTSGSTFDVHCQERMTLGLGLFPYVTEQSFEISEIDVLFNGLRCFRTLNLKAREVPAMAGKGVINL